MAYLEATIQNDIRAYSAYRYRRMASNEKAVISSFTWRTSMHYSGVISFYTVFEWESSCSIFLQDTRIAYMAPLAFQETAALGIWMTWKYSNFLC